MDIPMRRFIHGFIILLGLVLMVGGAASGTTSASIIGLIVAAVNFRELHKWNGRS